MEVAVQLNTDLKKYHCNSATTDTIWGLPPIVTNVVEIWNPARMHFARCLLCVFLYKVVFYCLGYYLQLLTNQGLQASYVGLLKEIILRNLLWNFALKATKHTILVSYLLIFSNFPVEGPLTHILVSGALPLPPSKVRGKGR